MSSTDNRSIHRRIFDEGVNQHDIERVDDLISPEYVNHDMPAPAPGREGFKQVMAMFFTAFPDMKVTIEDVIAEGDKVVSRGVFTGTHQGDFQGIPATQKSVRVKYIDIWRFEDGKAVENWVQIDTMGMMQQLGVIPGPS
jgi:steroid delta-isomerase-like uncharacterized protein